MKFHIISLFPESFDSYIQESIIARAIASRKISIKVYNPRIHAGNKHNSVDDRPYGGGPGMVLGALPILKTVDGIQKTLARRKKPAKLKIVIFSPSGVPLTNDYAQEVLEDYSDVILIAGRYEGIDARVKEALGAQEVTIGPYVLTGGELPAMVYVDVCTRRIDGVLGNSESLEESRVSCSEVYTRPPELEYEGKTFTVPEVLLSGDHKKIDEWKESRG